MLNDADRFAQPTHVCMQCGQPALPDAAACAECGSDRMALTTTRDSIAIAKRFAVIVSGGIVLLQASTLAFVCIFEFSTFGRRGFMVRDVDELFAAIGLHCLACIAGLCLLPLRAVPIGMKGLMAVLTLPLLWELLRLCLICTTDVRLPGVT